MNKVVILTDSTADLSLELKTEKGLDVKTSSPIIVYRETIGRESPEIEGRSPNKHNSFYMKVEPLEECVNGSEKMIVLRD